MNYKYSALFQLEAPSIDICEFEPGLMIERIGSNGILSGLLQRLKNDSDEKKYWRLIIREEGEPIGGFYSHRFLISFDDPDGQGEIFRKKQQEVLRAIVLTRIIKPLPIPVNPTIILEADKEIEVHLSMHFYGQAYTHPNYYDRTLNRSEADKIIAYWPKMQVLYATRRMNDDSRLIRAIRTLNNAYHIYPGELSNVITHSAVETLICTSPRRNKKQFVHRLPLLADNVITEDDAASAYDYCCRVKHAAEVALPLSVGLENPHPEDEIRVQAARKLDAALRYLILKALGDPHFANLLDDKAQLDVAYPIA